MKRFALSPTLLAVALLGGITAQAAPLQRNDVINDPLWLLHIDADGLKQTAIGQYVLERMGQPDAQKKIAAFQAIFNFDPRKELHGVTAYGATKAEDDGVLLVYADFDPARLTTLAEGAKEHKSTTHGTHTIHNWIDEKKKAKNGVKPRTYAAIIGKTVIFSQKESRVAEALDVMDRTKPNLSANSQFARLEGNQGFIQGAARKPELPGNDPNAAVLKQTKMATLNVQEAQKTLTALLTLEADSDDTAKNIENIGRGLISLISLQKDKPEAQKLVQALTLQQDGSLVTTKLALSADDAIAMMKAGEARKAAQKEENK